MNWFNNLSIFKKITIALIIASVSLIAIISFNFISQNANQGKLVELESKTSKLIVMAAETVVLLNRVDELYSQSVSFGDTDLKTNAENQFNNLLALLKKIEGLDPEIRSSFTSLATDLTAYQKLTDKIVSAMLNMDANVDMAAIANTSSEKAALFEKSLKRLQEYNESIETKFKSLLREIKLSSESAIFISLIISIIGFIAMLSVTLFIGKNVSSSSNNVANSLKVLAEGEGDLSHRLSVNSEDEIGKLSGYFNQFMALLQESIINVMNVAQPLLDNSTRLINNTEEAKVSTHKQSEDADNARQSMSELQQSVLEISNAATQAASLVADVERASKDGIAVVSKAVDTSKILNDEIQKSVSVVNRLAKDTENVHSILDVINSVAEQTNLLALNAAIEAARAGEHGRGFAVVADEVRSLASKTAQSTTEIRSVLDKLRQAATLAVDSMASAENKSTENKDHSISAGVALEKIKAQVEHISLMNNQIAAATEEQSMVTSHVVENITQMHASFVITERIFSDVESIAEQLHGFSDQLMEATSRFKV